MAEGDPTTDLAFPVQGVVVAVDSTLGVGSVALAVRGEIVASCAAEGDGKGKLPLLVSSLLAGKGLAPRDIDGIVVGHGPGRFTGVRSAVAVAKGLAWALDVPIATVGSLVALAAMRNATRDAWIVLGDGPRNLYAAPTGRAEEPVSFEIPSFVEARLHEGSVSPAITGAALDALREALREAGLVATILENELDARAHLEVVIDAARGGDGARFRVASVHDAEPAYVREVSITAPKIAPPLLPFR